MYEISGIFGIKLRFDGSLSRNKHTFRTTVNTERGVMKFIDEEKPFESVKIINLATREDLTEYFLGPKGDEI